MGRPSTIEKYIGKKIGGIKIIKPLGLRGEVPQRMWVECMCFVCGKTFEAKFHNVYKGNYKSCGCIQHGYNINSPKWKGHGEISESLFYSIKKGAENRGLPFRISKKYIWEIFLKQDRKCALSGEHIEFSKSRCGERSASLDRKDSSKGYIPGNLQWVHRDINYMKQSMTNEEFLNRIRMIYEYNK